MENKRRKNHENLEVVQEGFANGVAPGFPLSDKEKQKMIKKATAAYARFLEALKCDWQNDPNSMETPHRVAKAYVNDLWAGRYTAMSPITSFPSDGYDGVIIERNIPLTSMCSHHHQTIGGVVHIGYIAGTEGQVIGLSKLNRIVQYYSKRPQVQERLTNQIGQELKNILNTEDVAVIIDAKHLCVSSRGIKDESSATVTSFYSGAFNSPAKVAEFNNYIKQ